MPSETDGRIYVMNCPIHKPNESGTAWKLIHHCVKCPHHVSGHPMTVTSGVILCKHGTVIDIQQTHPPIRRAEQDRKTPPRNVEEVDTEK